MTKDRHAHPVVIAHRGASAYLPEHTLASKAVAHAMGADFLEQDIVLSRDNIPIVLHDVYLETTTDVAQRFPDRARQDGRFYAMDFDFHEIGTLKVHERSTTSTENKRAAVYPSRFPVTSNLFAIASLEEELDLIEGLNKSRNHRAGIYLEFKAPNLHADRGLDIVASVMEVLSRKGWAQRPESVYLQCFDPPTLQRLASEFATPLPLIQLIGENDWGEDSGADYNHMRTPQGLKQIASYAQGIGPWLHHIYLGKSADGSPEISDLTQQAHDNGLLVHPYTFRADELPSGIATGRELLDVLFQMADVDGIFSDFPDLVVDYLSELTT
ncbi:MAG: glycerophosphodiester phosphodiesterase [Pseudomonadota bacterium]